MVPAPIPSPLSSVVAVPVGFETGAKKSASNIGILVSLAVGVHGIAATSIVEGVSVSLLVSGNRTALGPRSSSSSSSP